MIRRHRDLTGSVIISILLLIGFLAAGIPAAQIFGAESEGKPQGNPAAKPDFVLTVKDNLISLKAKDASLKEVLEEMGRRMKIDVVASLPDNRKITAEFEKLSLEEAVNRLSTNHSNVMDSTKGGRKITKIIVLAKAKETALSRPMESAIKKEERSVKPETRVREEAVIKESPSAKTPGK
jgi:type II secretory pathway component GspD/PulD (secretin)